MKRFVAAAFFICGIFVLSACGARAGNSMDSSKDKPEPNLEENAYPKITAQEAKQMMEEKAVTVVDVRTSDEYAQQHIPGAILVPNETIDSDPPEMLPDKDAVILVHCRTGIRSKDASDKLVQLGYKNIYDFGGIKDWPYDTESGAFEKK